MMNTMYINKAGQREREFGDGVGVKESTGEGSLHWHNLLSEVDRETDSLN